MALPPSSPRLPSPPPPAEIQIGPKSPASMGATLAQQKLEQQMEQTAVDANAKRRIHPGTRAADFAVGPPLVPLNELQEHLAALHYFHTANNTQPLGRKTAQLLAQAPPGAERTLWLYELCRFLIAQCNSLIVGFLFDTPPCSAVTCPEMRASEWQFLCAVHEQPKSCCAIDYCCHTLDWAANVVTNPKIFPSRFVFTDAHDKNAAVKNLVNVFRRLHRIFAHAWFQHRGVFWSVEGQTGLYVFFKTVCDVYDLLPAENYKLPPEAEGLVAGGGAAGAAGAADIASMALASVTTPLTASAITPTVTSSSGGGATENVPGLLPMAVMMERKTTTTTLGIDLEQGGNSVGRTNTRRHIRSSPSTGSAVATVLEQDEDGPATTTTTVVHAVAEPLAATAKSTTVHVGSVPLVVAREMSDIEGDADDDGIDCGPEVAEVPVIVQHDIADNGPGSSTTEHRSSGGNDDDAVSIEHVKDVPSASTAAAADAPHETSEAVVFEVSVEPATPATPAKPTEEEKPTGDADDAVKSNSDTAEDKDKTVEAADVAAGVDEATADKKPAAGTDEGEDSSAGGGPEAAAKEVGES